MPVAGRNAPRGLKVSARADCLGLVSAARGERARSAPADRSETFRRV